jgi:oxygen-independent coproporphyrinogen-3 oxidase
MLGHLKLHQSWLEERQVTSVFVGGGTPSLMDPALLCSVLDAIRWTSDAEITIECNPDDISAALLDTYRAAGVNRISMGVQSNAPHVLQALGRAHDPQQVSRALDLIAERGFSSYSIDLIYGAHGESVADWRTTLETILGHRNAPPHISAYALIPEPGTPLGADPSRHPNDEDQADKYELTTQLLSNAGYDNYEISNWATGAAHESRHNWLYWTQADYLGVGCAAHSHRNGHRWWNLRTPDRYIDGLNDGVNLTASHEHLDHHTRALERQQLSLRTRAGVPSSQLDQLDDLVDSGLVTIRASDDHAVLTTAGKLVASEISHRLRGLQG